MTSVKSQKSADLIYSGNQNTDYELTRHKVWHQSIVLIVVDLLTTAEISQEDSWLYSTAKPILSWEIESGHTSV